MDIQAVIFDLDGTLVDSIQGIARSMNNVLERHGMPSHSPDSYKSMVGNGLNELVRRAVSPSVENMENLKLYQAELREEYSKYWDYGMKAYDGMEELHRRLRAMGIVLAVDTNKDEGVARKIVGRFFPESGFLTVAGNKPGVPKKPDPARALQIAREAGIQPQRCIYLGDSEVDIMTAKNAGMVSVSASWGFRSTEGLVSSDAGIIINKPLELMELIG